MDATRDTSNPHAPPNSAKTGADEASTSVHRPMMLISAGVLLSRVLGLVRDMVFASVWGASAAMGGWVFAFTLPNLLRSLFAEGAFSAGFVPVFSERLERDGRDAAARSASVIVSWLACAVVACALLVAAVGMAVRPFATNRTYAIALELLPLVMPYAVLIALSTAFAAALNALRRFTLPAFTPLLLNVFLIGAALLAASTGEVGAVDNRIGFLVPAVLAAGLLQLLLHLRAALRAGVPWRWRLDRRHADTQRVMRLMAPMMVGVGVMQLNVLVDRLLAGWLGGEAISSLYYSQRLAYLPVGLFGVALGVASLPLLSRAWSGGRVDEMNRHLRTALQQVFFLSVPVAVAFWVVRDPLIRLLFQRGAFGDSAVEGTLWAFLFYLPGIPAFACAKVATTPFHARQDTRTPVRIAAFCLALNIVLNLAFMPFLRQGGLALATSISSWINVALLLRIMSRSLPDRMALNLAHHAGRVLLAALGASVPALLTMHRLAPLLSPIEPAFLTHAILVAAPLAAFALTYLVLARALGCREAQELWISVNLTRASRSRSLDRRW